VAETKQDAPDAAGVADSEDAKVPFWRSKSTELASLDSPTSPAASVDQQDHDRAGADGDDTEDGGDGGDDGDTRSYLECSDLRIFGEDSRFLFLPLESKRYLKLFGKFDAPIVIETRGRSLDTIELEVRKYHEYLLEQLDAHKQLRRRLYKSRIEDMART
jgi:hypothetical protein